MYNSDDDAQFRQLKTTITTAGSSYWTGFKSTSNEWVSDLAVRMGMNPTYVQSKCTKLLYNNYIWHNLFYRL